MRLDGILKGVILFLSIISIYLPSDAQTIGDVLKKQQLKVLDIGNSYTNDATSYLNQITNASGSDINDMCLYTGYRGSGSFKTWYNTYYGKDNSTYTIKKVLGGINANITTGTGEQTDGTLFREALENENWDVIIIHQVSTYAPYYDMWGTTGTGGYLNEFLALLKEKQPQAKIGFLLIHSYWDNYSGNKEGSSFERWKLITESVKNLCSNYDVDFVIPYGTAVENLRSSSLNNKYDLTRDGTHCGYGLCCYTAACCYYESLIAPRSGISVLGNSARIDVSNIESKYPVVNVTDESALIAQEAAYLATKDMYHCHNPEDYIFKLDYKVDGELYKSEKMAYGQAISPEAAPTKEGYSFSGWGEVLETMPAHDVTVTGTFTINQYKLTYLVDGEEYKSYDIEYGSSITPEEALTKEGYTFSGWSEIPETMPANDVTIAGSFTVNKYLLSYNVDDEVFKSDSVDYNSTLTPIAEPTKKGYTFSGWSEIPETMPAHDVTVTGTFTQTEYRVGDDTYVITGKGTVTIKGSNQTGSVELSGIVEINGYSYQVTAIGENAFKDNTKITSVTISNGIMTIGDNAFNGCSHLKNINIGKDVNTIGHKTFANVGTASSASTTSNEDSFTINCYAEGAPLTTTDVFENTPIETGLLLVEDSSVDAYKAASPWSGFGTILGINEAAGINYISNDSPRAVVYDMQGRRINHLQKGLNIIRSSDGKTKKVVGF